MSTAEGRAYIRTPEFGSLKEHVLYFFNRMSGSHGFTTPELVTIINDTSQSSHTYSNPVSGALSRLHNVDMKVVRLKERRGGFNVYVLPEWIEGRDYYEPRRPRQPGGEFIVTDEMVQRAMKALQQWSDDPDDEFSEAWRTGARLALEAALNPEGEN